MYKRQKRARRSNTRNKGECVLHKLCFCFSFLLAFFLSPLFQSYLGRANSLR